MFFMLTREFLVFFLIITDVVRPYPAEFKPPRRVTHNTSTPKEQHNDHKNISELLDNLLRGYDNSVRPNFGGDPTVIEVDIMVRSMGPISEVDMTYSMDCYFRQSWIDRRLAFKSNKETLALSISMLNKIWKPDTYFYNGKQSYLHTITTPNKFVRLYQDGRVLYSSRLTIKAGCPMNLEDFPMDIQRCPLKFGSFGYTTKDVIYVWNPQRQVAIADDMKLSQFDLIATPSANQTDTFEFEKESKRPPYQRITTVLTMTFLGLEARTDLPKVPYPTALDFFVFMSFLFIFATILQFAVVHYYTKYGSGECYFSAEPISEANSDEEEWNETKQEPCRSKPDAPMAHAAVSRSRQEVINLDPCPVQQATPDCAWINCLSVHQQSVRYRSGGNVVPPMAKRLSIHEQRQSGKRRTPRYNSVSKIDRASRVFFPLAFFVINIFYWFSYLSRSERMRQRFDIP